METDPHKPLRQDVRLLGELLGETLREHEGARLLETVERVRTVAKTSRARADRMLRPVSFMPPFALGNTVHATTGGSIPMMLKKL